MTETVSSTVELEKPAPPTPRKAAPPKEIRLSTVLTGVVITALVLGLSLFAALWLSARGDLRDRDARASEDKHAEQLATDYALGASTIDHKNISAWFTNLKANTVPQLAAKFDATAPQLEQILLPLQWKSSATPLTAVVTSESAGIRKVNVFLNVNSASAQTPQGTQTTVTYAVTIDENAGWKITDVGGLDGALPGK